MCKHLVYLVCIYIYIFFYLNLNKTISTRRADAKLQPLSLNVLFSWIYWLSLILHQLPDAVFCIIPELINRLNEFGENAPGSVIFHTQ